MVNIFRVTDRRSSQEPDACREGKVEYVCEWWPGGGLKLLVLHFVDRGELVPLNAARSGQT